MLRRISGDSGLGFLTAAAYLVLAALTGPLAWVGARPGIRRVWAILLCLPCILVGVYSVQMFIFSVAGLFLSNEEALERGAIALSTLLCMVLAWLAGRSLGRKAG